MLQHIIHPIPPIYDKNSKILILGSFPSVKSREAGFFYGHPQNRYWKVLAGVFKDAESFGENIPRRIAVTVMMLVAVFKDAVPETIPDKKAFLLRHNIAAWDVIASCDIEGSSDASIKNAVPNDLTAILGTADIKQIFTNGKTAYNLFQKYTAPMIHRDSICLPSTSPANAAWTLDKLIEAWKVVDI